MCVQGVAGPWRRVNGNLALFQEFPEKMRVVTFVWETASHAHDCYRLLDVGTWFRAGVGNNTIHGPGGSIGDAWAIVAVQSVGAIGTVGRMSVHCHDIQVRGCSRDSEYEGGLDMAKEL